MDTDTEESALNLNKDEELQTPSKPKPKHRRRNICLAVTAAVIILIVVIIVILAFTVFKPKEPTTIVESITVENLNVALDVARLGVDLNITLGVDLSVTNPNKVGFKYRNGSALLNYRGQLVGEVPIPAGEIGSDDTKPMNISVTVMADRLISDPQLYADVVAGVLDFNSYIELSGKVSILKIFKVSIDTTTNCDFPVFINNQTVGEEQCKSKTKL
ncbi:Late embryogenesis abundant (LEA) hydroxyproline-rich glycoprotein family [Euphorbia peplus]|nr:Late embryogenesis abundant (LEA) hydroxyproline-rich glycoprotein family [Euphorbia peplus]